jgi:SAM-dependent methyltransferase
MHHHRRLLHAVLILLLGLPVLASAQSSAATPDRTSEQQIYDRYLTWLFGVPVEQRDADLLKRYRAALAQQGVTAAEIDRQIAIIERDGRRLEADRWNTFFTADKPRFNVMPNVFLTQIAERRTPGTALDMGMGQGRNSIWLARQGWQVTGFDPAVQAMSIAQQNAKALGLTLTTVEARDDTFDWGDNKWDLILLSYAGCDTANVPRIEKALKPGGVLIMEAFHTDAAKTFKIGGSICAAGETAPHVPPVKCARATELRLLRRGCDGADETLRPTNRPVNLSVVVSVQRSSIISAEQNKWAGMTPSASSNKQSCWQSCGLATTRME